MLLAGSVFSIIQDRVTACLGWCMCPDVTKADQIHSGGQHSALQTTLDDAEADRIEQPWGSCLLIAVQTNGYWQHQDLGRSAGKLGLKGNLPCGRIGRRSCSTQMETGVWQGCGVIRHGSSQGVHVKCIPHTSQVGTARHCWVTTTKLRCCYKH
jgi:hypothetical protein